MAEEVRVSDDPGKSRYEIFVGDRLAGFMTYRERPGALVILHTEVADEFEGHGLASQLVRFALDDIRARGLQVVPRCPLVGKYIRTHPDYGDLVAENAL